MKIDKKAQRFNDERDWFFEKRYGMFIHWGLYSIMAWHEQALWRSDTSREEYEKLINEFNPTEFDPDKWIDLAEEAGMEFICFTAKHHDGFCMWDTKFSDYNIMNTPYKNVFDALEDDSGTAKNLFIRSQLMLEIRKYIQEKDITQKSLKGRDIRRCINNLPISRFFRANVFVSVLPRALPWASICSPFRA